MFRRIACAFLALSWVFPVHAQTERLSNGRFNTDLSGWQLESGAFSSWSSTDADSNPTSGSVILSRTTASSGSGFELGLSQCLSWSERRGVNVRARILLPGGSDAQAALVVIPYASPDCSGPVLAGSLVRAYTTPRDVWIRASTFFNWLPSARSLKLALAMRNPSGPASVRFDEVSLRDTAQVGHHLSGTWYNAAWNGQGFVLDLANPQDSTAAAPFFGGWYTWSEAMPGQRNWWTIQGALDANAVVFSVYETRDGRYLDPAPVNHATIGQGEIFFSSCTQASLFAFVNGRSVEFPLERLTPVPNPSECASYFP